MQCSMKLLFATAFNILKACTADGLQLQYVRGNPARVTESKAVGGGEDKARSSYTPRVCGDGRSIVFKSDATLSSQGFEEDNDYHIWR